MTTSITAITPPPTARRITPFTVAPVMKRPMATGIQTSGVPTTGRMAKSAQMNPSTSGRGTLRAANVMVQRMPWIRQVRPIEVKRPRPVSVKASPSRSK